MPGALRRFEGEMRDNRGDGVIGAVLCAGLRNRQLDPLNPPETMSTEQRCSMVIQSGIWRDAYQRLESELSYLLASYVREVEDWLARSRPAVGCDLPSRA